MVAVFPKTFPSLLKVSRLQHKGRGEFRKTGFMAGLFALAER
jgi:hypothetical protein